MSTGSHISGRRRAGRQPFQFSIRTMFLIVAMAGGLFAVMSALGQGWSVVLCWFLILAAAHVAANAWGSKRSPSSTVDVPDPPCAAASKLPHESSARPACAPTTCLREKRRLTRPLLVAAVSALAGGASVGGLLLVGYLSRVGLAGVLIGALSAAVICGLFGYLATSCLEVTLSAFGEARRGARAER